MSKLLDIITAGNLAFLRITSAKMFKSSKEYQVLVEALKDKLGEDHKRNTHVYIWECEDIPPDCAAIVMVRPEDAKAIRIAHGKRQRLRGIGTKLQDKTN